MITSKKDKSAIVGLFIFAGLVIFAAGVLTLGRQQDMFTNTITVRSFFEDVKGLQNGNNIHFEGVKIGTVKSVELAQESRVEVTLKIDKKFIPYLYADMKAKVGADGLVGSKMVILSGGTEGKPHLKEGDVITSEKALTADHLLEKLEASNNNILAVTGDLKAITGSIANGNGSIGKLIHDETLYKGMQGVMDKLNEAAIHTKNITSNFEAFSVKLATKGGLANELVTDTVIFSSLREASVQIHNMTEEISLMTKNLKIVSTNLTQTDNPTGVLLNDKKAAENLKQTLENMRLSSEKLSEDFEALQHNFLLRHYFKKKKKKKNEAAPSEKSN